MRFAWTVLVVAVLFLAAKSAHANAAANFYRQPESMGALVLDREGAGIAVISEDLELSCNESYEHDGTCAFFAVYHLSNDGGEAITAKGAFYGADAGDRARATLDGEALPEIADVEARAAIDVTYKENLQSARLMDGPRQSEGRKVVTFELTLLPHAQGALKFAGELHAIEKDWEQDAYQSNALRTRHVYLVKEEEPITAHYRYLVFPIRAWRGDPQVHVRVHLGDTLKFISAAPEAEDASTPAPGRASWTMDSAGDHHATFRAKEVSVLDFRLELPRPRFTFGGPTLGVGGRLDRPDFRLRAGVETSVLSPTFIEGLHVETDVEKEWTIVPTVGAATPDLYFVVPSVGIAAGVPVRFESGRAVRVGGRAEVTVQFPFVGVVFPVDYYPAEDARGEHWDLSLLGRISL